MDAVLLYLLLTIIIDGCSARISTYSHSSGSSGSSTLSTDMIVAIIVPPVVVFTILTIVLVCCLKKCNKRSKTRVLPTQTQMAIMQQENQYAPPPYGQPPSYERPPSYSPFNDPTKNTFA
jgi:hypothetical protein